MSKKLNNKGFTLVELLAVLAILIAIMGVAIPSISSSMERTKDKQKKQKIEMLKSFAELYVTDHKNKVFMNNTCYITFDDMSEYLSEDATKDADGNNIIGYIEFKKPNIYTFKEGSPSGTHCV